MSEPLNIFPHVMTRDDMIDLFQEMYRIRICRKTLYNWNRRYPMPYRRMRRNDCVQWFRKIVRQLPARGPRPRRRSRTAFFPANPKGSQPLAGG